MSLFYHQVTLHNHWNTTVTSHVLFLRLDRKEGYKLFGQSILVDILNVKEWSETQVFPRVGMCRNTLEQMGNINNVFAQCLLPINMLNEKIYIFIYFFATSVLVLTILSVPLWIYRILCRKSHRQLVKRCLRMNNVYGEIDGYTKQCIDRFVVEFLRQDGNFIIRMLSLNVGDLMMASVICRLFQIYSTECYVRIDLKNRKKTRAANNDESMQIVLEKKSCVLKSSNNASAPSEQLTRATNDDQQIMHNLLVKDVLLRMPTPS